MPGIRGCGGPPGLFAVGRAGDRDRVLIGLQRPATGAAPYSASASAGIGLP